MTRYGNVVLEGKQIISIRVGAAVKRHQGQPDRRMLALRPQPEDTISADRNITLAGHDQKFRACIDLRHNETRADSMAGAEEEDPCVRRGSGKSVTSIGAVSVAVNKILFWIKVTPNFLNTMCPEAEDGSG